MHKLIALGATVVALSLGLSACTPGVYYPFGGGPQTGQYYVPAKGSSVPAQPVQPARKPGSEKTSSVVAG